MAKVIETPVVALPSSPSEKAVRLLMKNFGRKKSDETIDDVVKSICYNDSNISTYRRINLPNHVTRTLALYGEFRSIGHFVKNRQSDDQLNDDIEKYQSSAQVKKICSFCLFRNEKSAELVINILQREMSNLEAAKRAGVDPTNVPRTMKLFFKTEASLYTIYQELLKDITEQ